MGQQTIGYNMLLANTKIFQQRSVSLNTRDNKIVERAILVSGDCDSRFWWIFIYKHDITFYE